MPTDERQTVEVPRARDVTSIIFDMGGVLVESNQQSQGEFIATTLSIPLARVAATLPMAIVDLSKGLVDESTFWRSYVASQNGRLPGNWDDLWRAHYVAMATLKTDVIEIVKDLKAAGYQLALLSDTIPSHEEVNRQRGVFDLFTPVFLSTHIHRVKPDVETFQYVLRQLERPGPACVFVDDLPSNVDGAKKAGMKAIQFESASQLRADLARYSIAMK